MFSFNLVFRFIKIYSYLTHLNDMFSCVFQFETERNGSLYYIKFILEENRKLRNY